MSNLRDAWESNNFGRMNAAITKADAEIARLNSVVQTVIPQRDKARDEVKHKDGVIKQQAHQLRLNSQETARLTRERDEARDLLQMYRDCAHVDVTMERVYFLGVSRNEFQKVWEADNAALKGDKS